MSSAKKAYPIMEQQTKKMMNLVDRLQRKIGYVTIESNEDNLIFGGFVAGPAFSAVEDLFLSFEEAVDLQALSVVDELESEIAALGLHLRWPPSRQQAKIKDVQIWSDGGVSFQLCHDVLASTNGYQEPMAALPRVESLTGQVVADGVLV